MITRELKEKLKEELIRIGCLRFGEFVLSSGKRSNYYVDIKKASTNPSFLKVFAEATKEVIVREKIDFDKIACIELGGVPLAVSLLMKLEKPLLIFRKKRKDYGVTSDLIGEIESGEKFLVVEDVTTTGHSALSVVERVRKSGGEVSGVVVVVDRMEGAEEEMRKAGVKFVPLLTSEDLF